MHMVREKKAKKRHQWVSQNGKEGEKCVREIYGKGEEGGAVALRSSGLEWRS